MDIPFLGKWRERHAVPAGVAVPGPGGGQDAAAVADLLAECELLRVRAARDGVELDNSAASLTALDQLVPSWRDDPDVMTWLGNDAGLYLGTVIVHSVPGTAWQVWPNGHPVIRLTSGRELDTVVLGHTWAESGSPELSQVHAEASED
ncbi:DUF6278 family protein [Actinacidiphila rubida]|uniref:DUF3806 domain-containing protein n=1 Tax=Actinacidiphila rubida TaxID=310780 RepID=A0A1H8KY15_9ACTN|nr:DUF6278 family protein [Actinacidiphila rubida]SEN97763.1 hypothetical protein SAMN05216267_1014131 [Actinacidiphila rubida]